MALRGRRINNFAELWYLVASRDMEIWVSSTSFPKILIEWPQQPPTERVSDISKKMDFGWSIPQKGTGFDHLGARDDPNIRISIFLMKWGCWGHWGHWGCWGCRGLWGCKASKVCKITTDYCRVIQVPKFNFILMFSKQIFFVRIMKYQVEFWNLFGSWRLLRPAYVTFFITGGWNSNFYIS